MSVPEILRVYHHRLSDCFWESDIARTHNGFFWDLKAGNFIIREIPDESVVKIRKAHILRVQGKSSPSECDATVKAIIDV